MNIGIDAKWLFHGPPSGKVVTNNIVVILAQRYPQHHFILFLNGDHAHHPLPISCDNITVEYIWGKVNLFSNLFFLPWAARKHRIDTLLSFTFVSPFGNYPKIAFIFDVIFKSHPQHFTTIELLYFWPIKYLCQFAKRICTISQNEKQRMIQYQYGSNENIDLVYIGVNNMYQPREAINADVQKKVREKYQLPEKYLLYVGRLNDRKNLKNLIESVSLLQDKDIHLLLFGNYQWKSINLQSIIEQHCLRERIEIKGFADQEDLPVIYSLATIFTFVSYEEGFGLPILEAMKSGLPSVVAEMPVFRELFLDAVLYADPFSAGAIAQKIDSILNDSLLYKKLRQNGIRRATDFNWEKSAASLMETIYRTQE
jgi:glycosyltransferase involved in cell wall biosynthesis